MNSGSNPAKPSRLYAGSGSFPGGFPEDQEEYQPPALTSQAREDVERLRAKVRAHNPGYVYTNGVSLPSQIPSVPELLDELAYNVRAARTDRAIPNTPLPEVEQSELAKAGFDWKVIADRAISALETGTRRPLPLANDPEAATIPGLDVIAASRHESEPAAPAEPEVSVPVDEVSQPEVTEPPSAAEADLADAEPPLADVETPEVDEAAAPEAAAATEFSEPEDAADATEEAEPNLMGETAAVPAPPSPQPVDVALGEPAVLPEPEDIAPAEVPAEAVEEIDLSDEDLADLDVDDVDLDDLEAAPEPPAPNTETSSFEETLAAAEDLVSDRVYDQDVLEPEGNDDEQFVGDVEAETATWVTPDTPAAAEGEAQTQAEPDGSAQVPPEADTVPEAALQTAAQAEPENLLSDDVDLEADLDDLDLDDLDLGEFDVTEADSPEATETDAAGEDLPVEQEAAPAVEEVSAEQEAVEAPAEEETAPVEEEAIAADETAEEPVVEETMEEALAEEAPEAPAQETAPEADAEDAVVFEAPSEIEMPVEEVAAEPEAPLPGSEAIGSEVEEPEVAEDDVEVEYVEVSEDYEPEPGEEIEYIEVEDSSETPGEAGVEAVDSEESDLPLAAETADAADTAETAEETETDEAGELPFEIPTVEGDIPQAMQEGYSGWKPMTAENTTGADEELFAQPDDEPEAKPAKRGLFAKLFGRNKANQTED